MKIKSLAIGSFDGIHLAHQKLIEQADGVLVIEKGYSSLTPGWKRSLYTNKPTFFYSFDTIKHLSPEQFINKLKSDFAHLKQIVVGYDFVFGKNRSGNTNTLKELFDGRVLILNEVKYNNISIHSRVIRDAILQNNIALANKLLNRNYTIDGKQIKGLGLGSKELVPTINLQVKNYTLPNGVFASRATINNQTYKAVCFIGKRATVDNSFSIEVHILEEFKMDKNSNISIEFLALLRENQKFDSLVKLKEQISKDIQTALTFF